MKKIFTILMCVGMAVAANAQTQFVVSPTTVNGYECLLLGEMMSQNQMYVAGTDQSSQCPAMWNTETQSVILIQELDSTYVNPAEWGDDSPAYWEYIPKTGSFHGINNAGVAVGSITTADYISHPIMLVGDSYVTLYEDLVNDAGAEAYGITEDGSIIVGFYFDESWTARACIWTENGTVRTDLPTPTQAQMGIPVDYASARWISAYGDVILGYVQDSNNGSWVAVAWKRVNGEYVVCSFSNNYYQTTYSEDIPETPNAYYDFEPMALSENGNWVSLKLVPAYDLDDWDAEVKELAARYNLETNTLEVLNTDDLTYMYLEMFGIANNGTCVGRLTGEPDYETMSQPVDAVVWRKNETVMTTLFSQFPNDQYVAQNVASACSFITGDAAYAMGYASDEYGNQTTFYVKIDEPDAIAEHTTAISLYPNPATSYVKVELEENINALTIVNMMGQVVYSENVNNNRAMVNTSNLPAGLYIVNVVTDNGMSAKRLSIIR